MQASLALMIVLLSGPPTAKQILDPFTGRWEGQFKVYTYDGKLQDTLHVQQHYWWEGDIQHGRFIDTYPDGRVIKAKARNYEKDGRLVCEVDKTPGGRTVHHGRYTDGALFWFSKAKIGGKIESFKERVTVDDDGGRTYRIDGFGIYPGLGANRHLLFEGRYRQVRGPSDG